MARPDLSTFACVNPACHQCRHAGQGNLGIRKVYGHDHIRLVRCRTGGAAFAERRGRPWATRRSQRPQQRRSSIIWATAVACAPRPAWGKSVKRRGRACCGSQAGMPRACTRSPCALCGPWPWRVTTSGAV
jgi:hypothetical protein